MNYLQEDYEIQMENEPGSHVRWSSGSNLNVINNNYAPLSLSVMSVTVELLLVVVVVVTHQQAKETIITSLSLNFRLVKYKRQGQITVMPYFLTNVECDVSGEKYSENYSVTLNCTSLLLPFGGYCYCRID